MYAYKPLHFRAVLHCTEPKPCRWRLLLLLLMLLLVPLLLLLLLLGSSCYYRCRIPCSCSRAATDSCSSSCCRCSRCPCAAVLWMACLFFSVELHLSIELNYKMDMQICLLLFIYLFICLLRDVGTPTLNTIKKQIHDEDFLDLQEVPAERPNTSSSTLQVPGAAASTAPGGRMARRRSSTRVGVCSLRLMFACFLFLYFF